MNVLVKQKLWTILGRKYIISIKNKKQYIIEKVPFSIRGHYEIKDYSTWKVIGEIKNNLSLKANAKITIGKKQFTFSQEKLDSMTYHCKELGNNIEYLIQGNKGVNTTTFKNGEQIGYWTKTKFVILSGNRYDMVMNYDEDPILLSCFAVLVDYHRISVTIGGDIGWELGNLGKGLTKFNSGWKPKKSDENRR